MAEQWSTRTLNIVFAHLCFPGKSYPPPNKFSELMQFSREAYGETKFLI